ncbi:MAG TPA: DUF2062 domain-containing protein [Geobacteraceae bacterium]|nr:DUF2062 domain-containing protein [Geobacteraceae bacterium]
MHFRFGEIIRNSLTQGISPRKLALTVVLGIIVGTLPTVWGSSLVCAILAFFLGLNQAAIQAANFLAYPLQIALFLPFHHLGARIFPWGPSLSIEALLKGLRQDFAGYIALILMATLKAVAAWLLTAPALAVLLYLLLLTIFTRMVTPVQSGSRHSTEDGVRI